MKPSEIYLNLIKESALTEDSAQLKLLEKLDLIYKNLNNNSHKWFSNTSVKGLYIFGDVGRGKTQLMDIFFQSLKTDKKLRIHFHRFMKNLHEELEIISGSIDPIHKVVKRLAKTTKVLCFDEFFVEDIGDAMLLSRFLNKAFESGITLIATSNTEPINLYEDGLHRTRFLPAIDSIYHYCDTHELISDQDYRLRTLKQVPMYMVTSEADFLEEVFNSLMTDTDALSDHIVILGRSINPIKYSKGNIWFNFSELCLGPRSSQDYVELTKEFHTIMLSSVPLLTTEYEDGARRFIALVDECYERNVNLIISAEINFTELYKGSKLTKPFQRTISRLTEMQSKDFLSKPHLA